MIPRILVAGTHSGVGKTTVTVGLIQALRSAGWEVQPFKAGPDYIDPGYLTRAAGRSCRNLDTWLLPQDRLQALFVQACRGAQAGVIEGVMGLYDGTGAVADEGSTAELAKRLNCPVLLVVDASAVSRSAAAVVRGFVGMDRKVRIAGCFLNRVAGQTHYRLVKEGIERLAGVPVLGYLPRDDRLRIPERHLGLVPAAEEQRWRTLLRPLAQRMREGLDLPKLLRVVRRAGPLPQTLRRAVRPEPFGGACPERSRGAQGRLVEGRTGLVRNHSCFDRLSTNGKVRIAVAMDEAFHFYYPENLELLEDFGAEVVRFSPLGDECMPAGASALYLGGGFPEVFAGDLSRNRRMRESVRSAVAAGMPTYAECGGLMFLARSLTTASGQRYPMAGVIPAQVQMTDRLQDFGYQEVAARPGHFLARPGERARGHEFHHSALRQPPGPRAAAYTARGCRPAGRVRLEGYARGALVASYIHLHFWNQPRWARRFVESARRYKEVRGERCRVRKGRCRVNGVGCRGVLVAAALWVLWLFPSPFTLDPSPAFAEEPTRLEEVIVTASKAKTPAKRVTRAVSVIPAGKLAVVKGGFVSQGLSDVPETLVRRTGSVGRATAVVIRGASDRQVHVTLDGAHVASPTLGSFDFNHMTPDNLERIEVLRGPGSTLYGSDAMGGVIHLVTRRGEGPFTASYTQEYATLLDAFREAASFQGASGPWHLSGAASRLDARGLSQNDDYQNVNLSTRIGYDFPGGATLDMSLRHLFAIIGIDDGAFRPDPNRRDRERNTFASATAEIPVNSAWSHTLRVSTSQGNFIDSDPSNGGTEADSLFKLDTERYGAEWRHRFTPVEWDAVTVGMEFEDREADNRSFSKAQANRSLYLQNQWIPWDPLTILAGVRLFRESAFGSDHVLDASAAYFFAPWNLKLRGGWGEGFRAPSLNELFFPNFGNPNLAPEKSETFEFGADQVLWEDRVSWSGTLFRTDYEDLIQFVSVSATTSEPRNVGRSRVSGAELELQWKPWEPWVLTGSYTHLKAQERPSGEELLRIPKNTVAFSVGLIPDRSKWEARLEGLLVSSREESRGTNRRDKTKGYLKFDLYAHYRVTEWLKGYLRVDNLASRQYSEVLGFPAEGLVVSLGVTVEK